MSPSGLEWKADVLCSRPQSGQPIAFEIQWSSQELAVTEFRQRRYADSGVSAIWLMRQRDVSVSRDVPAFVVDLSADHRPIVLIPSHALRQVFSRHASAQDDHRISQRVPLESFVTGTLNGGLKFAPAVGTSVPANAMAAKVSCWKCRGDTQVVLGVELLTDRVFPGFGNVSIEIDNFDAHGELGHQWVETFLPAELLRQWGAGEIKLRPSKAQGQSYLSNGCVHCDALYGRFYYPDLLYDVTPLFEVHVAVEPWLAGPPEQTSPLKRWWFDTGASATPAPA
jgi:competence protein CoiA